MSQTFHKNLWQWLRNQIVLEVPASEALCEYDCRKQLCTEKEWATCERRIQRAAGELWPKKKQNSIPAQFPKLASYRSAVVSQAGKEQALARLKCAHCQSLFNCDALAELILAELRRCRIEYRRACGDGLAVTDSEFIEAVRRGIDSFLCDSSGSKDDDQSCSRAG